MWTPNARNKIDRLAWHDLAETDRRAMFLFFARVHQLVAEPAFRLRLSKHDFDLSTARFGCSKDG